MKEVFAYCKSPYFIEENKSIPLKLFLKIWIISELASMLFAVPGALIEMQLSLKDVTDELDIYLAISGILYIPLIEEFGFRLLLKPTLKKIKVYLLVGILIATLVLLDGNFQLALAFIMIMTISISYFFLKKYFPADEKNIFKWYFYIIAISFGLFHITNYDELEGLLLFAGPIFVLPQIFMGFILGYMRMKFGFKIVILFHLLVNLKLIFFLF